MAPTRPKAVAAMLFAICAALIAGIWIIFLFVSNPKGVTALDNLSYALSSARNEDSGYFKWLTLFLVVSATLSAAYCSAWARSKNATLILLTASVVQAIAAILVLPWTGIFFFVAPLPWCYLNWQRA